MKKILFISILLLFSCKKTDRAYTYDDIDFKEEMRNFVMNISNYAKNINTGFSIIPQNGAQLLTINGEPTGEIHQTYNSAIDAQAQEGLFYGYEQDDVATPEETTLYLKQFLDQALNNNKAILITDYCYSPDHIMDSYQKNDLAGYTGFVATSRELDMIPTVPVHHVNSNDINRPLEAQNFLYLLNPHQFADKTSFLNALRATNYDLLIIDLFFNDGTAFSPQEIASLKIKANGGKRLVVSYISIGEAEDYRYYWNTEWGTDKPEWLESENPEWEGNYKVKYWEKDWQQIIYGNEDSYLKKIIDAGFDGAYLDIIDAFEYFEERY